MKYFFKRIIFSILMLFSITIIAFFLSIITPGNPAELALSGLNSLSYTKEDLINLEKQMGLDKSYFEQYITWIINVFNGTWGKSFITDNNIFYEIKIRLPYTFKLAFSSLIFSITLSFVLGIFASLYRNSYWGNIIESISIFFISIPSFWIAIILMYIFSINLKILPSNGTGSYKHYILPVITLSLSTIGIVSRFIKSLIENESLKLYVIVAKSKGFDNFYIIKKHILPNIFIPLTAYFGNYLSGILGGSVIIESVFSINGLGKYALDSVHYLDYPALQGYVLVTGLIYIIVNLLVDIFYIILNPKIKIGSD